MILNVRTKADGIETTINTEEVANWDELYVGLSYQPLGRFKDESYTLPDGKIMPGKGQPRDGKMAEVKSEEAIAYEEKFGKEVPNNKKNDIEWIKSKLAE